MRELRWKGTKMGLILLVLGMLSGVAAALLAVGLSTLHEAARFDLPNAGFLLLLLLAAGAVGNGFVTLGEGRAWFAWCWWGSIAFLAVVLFGVCLKLHVSLPFGLVVTGGALLVIVQVAELIVWPFWLVAAFRDARKYPNSGSLRLVRPRRDRA